MTPLMVHFPGKSTGALARRVEDVGGRELEFFLNSGRPPNRDYKPPDFLSLAKPSGDSHGHSCAITVAFLIVRKNPPRKLIFLKHKTCREVAQSLHKQAHYVFSKHDPSPHGKLLLIHRKSIAQSHNSWQYLRNDMSNLSQFIWQFTIKGNQNKHILIFSITDINTPYSSMKHHTHTMTNTDSTTDSDVEMMSTLKTTNNQTDLVSKTAPATGTTTASIETILANTDRDLTLVFGTKIQDADIFRWVYKDKICIIDHYQIEISGSKRFAIVFLDEESLSDALASENLPRDGEILSVVIERQSKHEFVISNLPIGTSKDIFCKWLATLTFSQVLVESFSTNKENPNHRATAKVNVKTPEGCKILKKHKVLPFQNSCISVTQTNEKNPQGLNLVLANLEPETSERNLFFLLNHMVKAVHVPCRRNQSLYSWAIIELCSSEDKDSLESFLKSHAKRYIVSENDKSICRNPECGYSNSHRNVCRNSPNQTIIRSLTRKPNDKKKK